MKKELVDRINTLIDHCIVTKIPTQHEAQYHIRWFSDQNTQYSFKEADAKDFEEIVSQILYAEKNLNNTLSRKYVADKLRSLIQNCKQKEITTNSADIHDHIVKELLNKPLVKSEVFHKIEGLIVSHDKPISIGLFTFYNFPSHKNLLTKKYSIEKETKLVELLFSDLDKHDTWVSIEVSARDNIKAHELANEYFDQLQNVLRFLISLLGSQFDVGILNYKKWDLDECVILNKNLDFCYRGHRSGALLKIDFKNILAEISTYGFSPESLIENVSNSSPTSQMQKRLMTAIDLYGRAIYDIGRPICFLESMMAIEALIQMNSNQLVNQSISAQISEYCAFLLAEKYEDRIGIEKTVKALYRTRSKLAHGTATNVTKDDYRTVLCCARELIITFLINEVLCQTKTENELQHYIQKLKYN